MFILMYAATSWPLAYGEMATQPVWLSAYVQIGVRCSVFFVRYCDELAPGVWLSVCVQIGIRSGIVFCTSCDDVIDDFLILSASYAKCETDMTAFIGLCEQIGFPLAHHKTKTLLPLLSFWVLSWIQLGWKLDSLKTN